MFKFQGTVNFDLTGTVKYLLILLLRVRLLKVGYPFLLCGDDQVIKKEYIK